MLHVSAIMAITALCHVSNDSTHHLVRERPVFVIVYFPLFIVVKNLSDCADNYVQMRCFYCKWSVVFGCNCPKLYGNVVRVWWIASCWGALGFVFRLGM